VTVGDRRRVTITAVRPQVDCGRYPAKATAGLALEVSATMITEGTSLIQGWAWQGPASTAPPAGETALPKDWDEVALEAAGQDQFSAWITPASTGEAAFGLVGIVDDYGTWLRDLRIRIGAGQEVGSDLAEGAEMVARRTGLAGVSAADRAALKALAASLRKPGPATARLQAAEQPEAITLMRRTVDRSTATVGGPFPLWVDRELAGFSAWYEMFPRSEGAVPPKSGTFRTAARRLPAIAGMGFDVLYLPPIHPIGVTNRKGRNNSLDPTPQDPGSPWAIGAAAGGHDAVDPSLGSLADFTAFAGKAKRAGLEIALDYALQCSPDHPWVTEHPDWFRHRPDGSIHYAENPPKRYQDIYPIDFDSADSADLWLALRDVMYAWIKRGVHIFRVDNPHTKSLRFWEWLIGELHRDHPDVILLSEAFTRPDVMYQLAKLGFTQSYTYFTWRNFKWEITQYLTELSQTEVVDWFRPNFWVNTPDILHATLQYGGAPAFRLRASLAAITGPSWGMYSGYELIERTPLREGSEEYVDSEKYQLRPRNWKDPSSIAPFIAGLNEVRRRHRDAIAQLRTLRVHHIDNESMVCVSRTSVNRDDRLLLVLNLDPSRWQEGTTRLDLDALGLDAHRPFRARDELTGADYIWQGPANYVRLDPAAEPAHILHLTQP
jgi:starch synthase (maltosyl-transferring)